MQAQVYLMLMKKIFFTIPLIQIYKVISALGDFLNVTCVACIGGTNVRKDMEILQNGAHVVVGTPGRVFDMIGRGALNTDSMKMFILDEADEMLSRGFKDQIYDVFRRLPTNIQVSIVVFVQES